MSTSRKDRVPPGYKVIFVRSFRHHKTGKIIRPKRAKAFRFVVPA